MRQDTLIQELLERQQYLYGQIRDRLYYIYRAEGQPIYDEYQQGKRDIDRLLKEEVRALKVQLRVDYDATAPMQDMLAQIAVNDVALSPVQPLTAPVKYTFEERARIAQTFFDPSPSAKCDGISHSVFELTIRREAVSRHQKTSRTQKRTLTSNTTTSQALHIRKLPYSENTCTSVPSNKQHPRGPKSMCLHSS